MRTTIRPTREDDVPAAARVASWAKADGWRERARSLVALLDDEVGGTVITAPNPVHPVRDNLFLSVAPEHTRSGIGTDLVESVRALGLGPFSTQAHEGTAELGFFTALGATTYQICPRQQVRTDDPALQAWTAPHRATVVRAADLELDRVVDAVTERYLWQHASWSPVRSAEAVRLVMDREVREGTDLAGSALTVRDGTVTAVCDLYSDGTPTHHTCCVEAVDPALPTARADVAACIAAVIDHLARGGGGELEFDGHVTDPHFAPLLHSMPGVGGRECYLLEVPRSG